MRRRRIIVGLAAVVALGGLLAAAPRGVARPNVVLIVVDTLRADRLGKGLTPFLDDLARRGVVFTHAYAPSSWTWPSVASLFTSRYVSQHGVVGFESRLADDELTLAERLVPPARFGRLEEILRRDYLAAGFSANWRLMKTLGYAQGFRTWRSYATRRKPRAGWLGRRCLRWLDSPRWWAAWNRWFPRPLLLYLHFMEPHAPYDPPARDRPSGVTDADVTEANRKLFDRRTEHTPDDIRFVASLYDGETASLDRELRRLFGDLEARGVLRDAVVVFTADHGEEFAEHGLVQHGQSLYEPAVRVPLVVLAPGLPAGRVIDANVSLLDVAPTVLDLVGLPAEPRFEGRSLLPVVRGPSADADVMVELLPSSGADELRRHNAAFVRGSMKLIVGRAVRGELFDLAVDPAESAPIPPGAVGDAAGLLRALQEKRADVRTRAGAGAPSVPLDAGARERLRALGYVD